MTEIKDPRYNKLAQSLINFLVQKKDIEEKVNGGARRVRSLSFNITQKDGKVCFVVQIGMCEAAFNANNGLKEKGSCFGLERYIRDWYEMPSVNMEIKSIISQLSRTEIKKVEEEEEKQLEFNVSE